jgi:hypothetical protein
MPVAMRFQCWPLVFLASTITACTATVSGSDVAGDAERTTTSAIVVVERTADPAGGAHVGASARFVRVASASSANEAMRAIGATFDLPMRGSCAPLASLGGSVALDDPAPFVELIDVGSVSLEVNGSETRLVPRQLPDVTDIVSGVVYARAPDPAALPSDSRYVVHVGGGSFLPSFDASAMAPAAPSDIRVAGEDASGAVLTGEGPVQLSWIADAVTDNIYVDVQPGGIRCVLKDERGDLDPLHGSVPASVFDDAGLLVIHRLHREALHATGLDGGELRFDFARTLAYRRL